MITINAAAGDSRLEPPVLDTVFDMWWPKLEAQATEILKSHEKGARKEKRSDRDILEEVLELSRMSSARSARPSRISPRALMELFESLDELTHILTLEHGEMGLQVLSRIDRPLRHLCMEAGLPELHERFGMRLRRRLGPPIEEEKKAESSRRANADS